MQTRIDHRDVVATIAGVERRLRLTHNSLCELERILGRPFGAIFSEYGAGVASFTTIRAILWAALLEHDPAVTIKAAGDYLDETPIKQIGEALVATIKATFPDVDTEKKTEPAPPGTGEASDGSPTAPSV